MFVVVTGGLSRRHVAGPFETYAEADAARGGNPANYVRTTIDHPRVPIDDMIADMGIVEKAEVKKVMAALKRRANAKPVRKFPKYVEGHTITNEYVRLFCNMNHLKVA